jgi:hypothetical protein
MKKKINELELYQVDYLIAKHEKLDPIISDNCCLIINNDSVFNDLKIYDPTTNPLQAWPIIEREMISINYSTFYKEWYSEINDQGLSIRYGKTLLESAMRCFCESVYGKEVEI